MNTLVGVSLVLVGAAGTLRFRQIADWFDRVMRTLVDGPDAPEPSERSIAGQWFMAGSGSSIPSRWQRYLVMLVLSIGCLVGGAGGLAGAWHLVG